MIIKNVPLLCKDVLQSVKPCEFCSAEHIVEIVDENKKDIINRKGIFTIVHFSDCPIATVGKL